MKKFLALMMVLCLAMFVVACGPQAEEQPEGDDTETTDTGDVTDTGDATEGDATDDGGEGEMEMLPDLGADAPVSPLEGSDEPDIDGLDPLKPAE